MPSLIPREAQCDMAEVKRGSLSTNAIGWLALPEQRHITDVAEHAYLQRQRQRQRQQQQQQQQQQ